MAAIDKAKVDAVVGYTQRFRRRFQVVKQRLRDNQIGEVTTDGATTLRLAAINRPVTVTVDGAPAGTFGDATGEGDTRAAARAGEAAPESDDIPCPELEEFDANTGSARRCTRSTAPPSR